MSCTDSALDLINLSNEDRIEPFLNRIWSPLLGVSLGIGFGCAINFGTRRPVFSGIQKHALGIILCTSGLSYVEKLRTKYLEEKDAVLRHYIQLHPEDFPAPERKKIGDLFEPWIPVR